MLKECFFDGPLSKPEIKHCHPRLFLEYVNIILIRGLVNNLKVPNVDNIVCRTYNTLISMNKPFCVENVAH